MRAKKKFKKKGKKRNERGKDTYNDVEGGDVETLSKIDCELQEGTLY